MKLLTRAILITISFAALLCLNAAYPKVEEILLTEKNTVNLVGVVNSSTVASAQDDIAKLRKADPKGVIYLVINSPGGDMVAGLDFERFLASQSNIKTITLSAASMASAIVEANPGERLIVADGTLMFHRATVGLQGQINEGEMESRLAYFKQIVSIVEQRNIDRIGLSKEEYKKKVAVEWWLIGADAIKANTADRIVKVKCDPELMTKKDSLEVPGIFGIPSKVDISKCPLMN